MKITTKVYECEYKGMHEEYVVEEVGKRDFANTVSDLLYCTVDGVLDDDSDDTVWIEYNDGSVYSNGYGCVDGKFKKVGIKFGCYSNSATYIVTGEYVFEDGDVYAA